MDSTTGNTKNGFIVDTFVLDQDVRTTWIAFFVLWVFWGVLYLFRHFAGFYGGESSDAEGGEKSSGKVSSGVGRLEQAHRVTFENVLLLLAVLVLNTFGSASTRAAMILAWIFVGLTIVYALTELVFQHHISRIFFGLAFFGITLAIGGLAIQQGW